MAISCVRFYYTQLTVVGFRVSYVEFNSCVMIHKKSKTRANLRSLCVFIPHTLVPVLGGTSLFELTLAILFVVGAIYWFGFKRSSVIAGGERRAEALSD